MKRLFILSIITSLSLFSATHAEDFSFEDSAFDELDETILSLDEDFFNTPSSEITLKAEQVLEPLAEQKEELIISSEKVDANISFESESLKTENNSIEEISDPLLVAIEEQKEVAFSPLMQSSIQETSKEVISASKFNINLEQVFKGAPIIYSVLFLMSMATVFIWFYSLMKLKHVGALPEPLLKQLRQKLHSNQYDEALALCSTQNNFFCKMLAAGISSRTHGLPVMFENMKTEGKRATVTFWQRLAFLNDIALIAPMLGLLGTVLGMFYAFYDLNRSMESFSILFDGLGVSVGTTVAGLIVAIIALMLHSIAKYRLVRLLVRIENEAQSFASLIDNKTHYAP